MSDCSFTQRGVFSISIEVLTTLSWLLHGRWCHVKLLPSRRAFCVGENTYNHAPQCYSKPHTYNECMFIMNVCLAVTCHLHIWQNDWNLLRATAVAFSDAALADVACCCSCIVPQQNTVGSFSTPPHGHAVFVGADVSIFVALHYYVLGSAIQR